MSAADELQIKLTARDQLTARLKDARTEANKLAREFKKASDELRETGKGEAKVKALKEKLEAARKEADKLGDEAQRSKREIVNMARDGERKLKEMATQATKTRRSLRDMASGVGGKLSSVFTKGAIGVGAFVGAMSLATFGMSAFVGAAMDAEESNSRFAVVFNDQAAGMERWIDSQVKMYGANEVALKNAAAQFAIFGKAAEVPQEALGMFSGSLVNAGRDLASFFNASDADVFAALLSGLSGEAEPLRQFGIFLSDAAVQSEAALAGMTGELTDQQKVVLRHRLIMKSLGDSVGDLERTSNSGANQVKALRGELSNAAVDIGYQLLPSVVDLVKSIRDELPTALPHIQDLANKFGTEVLPKVADLVPRVADLVVKLTDFGTTAMPYVASAIETAGPVLDYLATVVGTIRDVFNQARDAAKWFGEQLAKLPGGGSAGGLLGEVVDKGKYINPAWWAVDVALGDSAMPRGHDGATIAHSALASMVAGPQAVSGVRSFALGSPWSDHLSGAAMDYTGSNLPSLADAYRRAGGFAEFHGQGAQRHLHAVAPAIGDSSMPRAVRPSAAPTTGGSVVVNMTVNAAPGMDAATVAELAASRVVRKLQRARELA